SSPLYHTQATNIAIITPEPTKRPIIVAELQGFSCPPLCKARSSMKIAGTKMTHPIKSRRRRLPPIDDCRDLGRLKKSHITVKDTAINGRLILLLLGLLLKSE